MILTVPLLAALSLASSEAAARPGPKAPVEYFVHAHQELDIERDSPKWNALSEEEKAKHEDEPGVFADASDTLVLQERGRDRLALCLSHTGMLLHLCQVSGVATRDKNGDFVLRDPSDDPEATGDCVLVIRRTRDKMEITESENPPSDCRRHCGWRASFSDIEFALTDKLDAAGLVAQKGNLEDCELPP